MSAHLLLRSWSSRRHAIRRQDISRYLFACQYEEYHSFCRLHVSKCSLVSRLKHYNITSRWHGHSHGSSLEDEESMENRVMRLDLSSNDVKAADRITWVGVWLNVVLGGLKGAAGVAFNSSGLLADAVHSISDLVSDFVTIGSLKYCSRPPDALQPYGYGKFETIGALSVSLLLVGGSFGIIAHSLDSLMVLIEPFSTSMGNTTPLAEQIETESVKNMVKSVHNHAHEIVMHPAALGIAALSVVAKEALFRTTISIGQRLHSSVLIANAWHHRSDAVTSMVAMSGIGLSLAGFPFFDPLAGIALGGIILKMGAEMGWNSTKELCDAKLSDTIIKRLESAVDGVIASSDGKVLGVRQLRSRKVGRHIHVDLTLVVDNASALDRAVEWKQKVKSAITHNIPRVNDIVVEITTPEQLVSAVVTEGSVKHDHVPHGRV